MYVSLCRSVAAVTSSTCSTPVKGASEADHLLCMFIEQHQITNRTVSVCTHIRGAAKTCALRQLQLVTASSHAGCCNRMHKLADRLHVKVS